MPTYFVTGASRGIGLELVRQLLSAPSNNTVIAAVRNVTSSLSDLKGDGKLTILTCDVSDPKSIAQCCRAVVDEHDKIDVVFNNAGINLSGGETAAGLDTAKLDAMMKVHVYAPALIVQALEPVLRGSIVINFASGLGSSADTLRAHGPKGCGYSISKAATVMLTVKQATQYKKSTFVSLDPGWVQTDMGGPGAVLPVKESVAGILKVVGALKPKDTGKFLLYDGSEVPY